jgi:ceramide glucosyltransferase
VQDWDLGVTIGFALVVAAVAWSASTSVAALLQPLKRRLVDWPDNAPPLSVIVPVRAPAPALQACVTALARLDYPAFEVILCAASDDRESARLVQDAATTDSRIRICLPAVTTAANPKVALLAAAMKEAQHDLLLMTDDNVIGGPTRVQTQLAYRNAGFGLVSACTFGMAPENFWSEVDGAFMNGHFARLQRAGDAVGLSYATGKSMLVSRHELLQSGGIATAGRTLCEDAALQQQLRRRGQRATLSHEPLVQPLGRRDFAEVWHRHLRWAVCRRRHAPLLFTGEALLSAPVAALAAGASGLGFGIGFALACLAAMALLLGIEWTFLVLARCQPSWRFPAAWLAREALTLPLWLAALAPHRIVVWRQRALPMRT